MSVPIFIFRFLFNEKVFTKLIGIHSLVNGESISTISISLFEKIFFYKTPTFLAIIVNLIKTNLDISYFDSTI